MTVGLIVLRQVSLPFIILASLQAGGAQTSFPGAAVLTPALKQLSHEDPEREFYSP